MQGATMPWIKFRENYWLHCGIEWLQVSRMTLLKKDFARLLVLLTEVVIKFKCLEVVILFCEAARNWPSLEIDLRRQDKNCLIKSISREASLKTSNYLCGLSLLIDLKAHPSPFTCLEYINEMNPNYHNPSLLLTHLHTSLPHSLAQKIQGPS